MYFYMYVPDDYLSLSLVHFHSFQYTVKVRRHTPWSIVVRCRGSQECGSRFVNFACQFHSRRHSLRITLKSTTLVCMRYSNKNFYQYMFHIHVNLEMLRSSKHLLQVRGSTIFWFNIISNWSVCMCIFIQMFHAEPCDGQGFRMRWKIATHCSTKRSWVEQCVAIFHRMRNPCHCTALSETFVLYDTSNINKIEGNW